MEKFIIITLAVVALAALITLAGCAFKSNAVGDNKFYSITSDIKSFEAEVNAADFKIVTADSFSVESNLKSLKVTEQDGVLKIVDKSKHTTGYDEAKLTLCIPQGVTFENAFIKTGASKLTADTFSANTLELKTGAGEVVFENLAVNSEASLKGGAGEIRINGGVLNNLNVDLGVGELDMTAQLKGKSNLKFGVGESDITLIGNIDDYSFDVKNGVGRVNIDGVSVLGFVGRLKGENTITIKGGVGSTNINFQ